jgi:hypothetical protein
MAGVPKPDYGENVSCTPLRSAIVSSVASELYLKVPNLATSLL